jgi:hypothetical protein
VNPRIRQRRIPGPLGHIDEVEFVNVGRVAAHTHTPPTTTDIRRRNGLL